MWGPLFEDLLCNHTMMKLENISNREKHIPFDGMPISVRVTIDAYSCFLQLHFVLCTI